MLIFCLLCKFVVCHQEINQFVHNNFAQKQVKMRLIIAAIVKAENIKAEEAEIEAKIADFAKGANKSVEEFKKTMHPEQASYIENEIVMNKLIDFLMANNKFA